MPITITRDQLAAVVNGRTLSPLGGSVLAIGAHFDSREVGGGQMFFALPGEKMHGHKFLPQAYERGASLFVVESEDAAKSLPDPQRAVIVGSTSKAFFTLATWWRRTLQVPTIAITGSVGKTTVKEMTAAILSQTGQGSWSPKSFNNHTGVPFSILRASQEDSWLVLEMGMNHPGEIKPLTECAEPDVAVVTTVAPAHIEFFGTLQGIAQEKISIALGLHPEDGVLILNAENGPLMEVARSYPHKPATVLYVGKDAECSVFDVESHGASISFSMKLLVETARITMQVPGKHNAMNAACAALAAKSLDPLLTIEQVVKGLEGYQPPEMRLQTFAVVDTAQLRGRQMVDDSYNANPESMRSLLAIVKDYQAQGKRVAVVLGEMKELGEASEQYHREIGAAAARINPEFCLFVGGVSGWYAQGAQAENARVVVHQASDPAQAAQMLKELPFDVVFIKGSRGARLDLLVQALR